jgi:hypothetical protein
MESLFDKEANPSGPTSKAIWNQCPGRVRTPFSMIHIWIESLFDKEANPSGPTSKAVRNQWKSSKQVTV